MSLPYSSLCAAPRVRARAWFGASAAGGADASPPDAKSNKSKNQLKAGVASPPTPDGACPREPPPPASNALPFFGAVGMPRRRRAFPPRRPSRAASGVCAGVLLACLAPLVAGGAALAGCYLLLAPAYSHHYAAIAGFLPTFNELGCYYSDALSPGWAGATCAGAAAGWRARVLVWTRAEVKGRFELARAGHEVLECRVRERQPVFLPKVR